ncbi:hypothetical protein BKA93DRAFT_750559 [Sparassis latifolia]
MEDVVKVSRSSEPHYGRHLLKVVSHRFRLQAIGIRAVIRFGVQHRTESLKGSVTTPTSDRVAEVTGFEFLWPREPDRMLAVHCELEQDGGITKAQQVYPGLVSTDVCNGFSMRLRSITERRTAGDVDSKVNLDQSARAGDWLNRPESTHETAEAIDISCSTESMSRTARGISEYLIYLIQSTSSGTSLAVTRPNGVGLAGILDMFYVTGVVAGWYKLGYPDRDLAGWPVTLSSFPSPAAGLAGWPQCVHRPLSRLFRPGGRIVTRLAVVTPLAGMVVMEGSVIRRPYRSTALVNSRWARTSQEALWDQSERQRGSSRYQGMFWRIYALGAIADTRER